MKTIIVSKQAENQRVDKYIMKVLEGASKGFIYKMFRKKNIRLNGHKIEGHEILQMNDEIIIYFTDETFNHFNERKNNQVKVGNQKQRFTIVYEDENLLICNKPVNLLSQPDGKEDDLVSQIEGYLGTKDDYVQTPGFRLGVCNRLDRNTSGIVVSGKNIKALQILNGAFANHSTEKKYLTIVAGKVESAGVLEGYLSKDTQLNKVSMSNEQGDYIKTSYQPLKYVDSLTLLEVNIETGKTHQIRLHLSSIGHPIIGDVKYGDETVNTLCRKKYGVKSQMLHAYQMKFFDLSEPLVYLNERTFLAKPEGIFKKMMEETFQFQIYDDFSI